MNAATPQPVPSNAFPQMLAMIDDGAKQNEASGKLVQLLEAVTSQRKRGSLTITLNVTPASGATALDFDIEISAKLPKAPTEKTLLFVSPEHGYQLSKQSFKQRNLEFSEVPKTSPAPAEELPKTNLNEAQAITA